MLVTDMRKSMQGIVGRLPATSPYPSSKALFSLVNSFLREISLAEEAEGHIYTISGAIRRTLFNNFYCNAPAALRIPCGRISVTKCRYFYSS